MILNLGSSLVEDEGKRCVGVRGKTERGESGREPFEKETKREENNIKFFVP